uniref:Kolobok-8 hm n=1 Tax=Rhipicephalus zambeziensis TaxID=60191 RepID=A0A224Z1F7_9ACAR
MAGGHRKFRTAHAFGKKRRRRPRARSVSPARPSAAENTEEAGCANAITNAAPAITGAIAGANDHTRAVRVDTPLVSDAEKVAIECRASDIQRDLSSTSATRRKRSFFRDSEAAATTGTPFTVVSLAMVNELLQYMKCGVCGGPSSISKEDREYGIAAKLVLTCDECGELKTVWSSPRVGGDAARGPFEINVLAVRAANFRRAMKRKRTKENDDDYTPGGF